MMCLRQLSLLLILSILITGRYFTLDTLFIVSPYVTAGAIFLPPLWLAFQIPSLKVWCDHMITLTLYDIVYVLEILCVSLAPTLHLSISYITKSFWICL